MAKTIDALRLDAALQAAEGAGELAPFWVVTGSDDFLRMEACDKLRAAANKLGYEERTTLTMDARSDWAELMEAGATMGMFAERKLVEVRLASAKPGLKGAAALSEYCTHAFEGVVTVLTLPEPDWRDAKAAWWKAVSGAGVLVKCDTISRAALPAWLGARLKAEGLGADAETLETFADLVEGNLFAAAQEVRKLALLYPEGELTRERLERAVADASHFETDGLLAAYAKGEAAKAARIVDALRAQDVALPFLLAMLTNHIRSIVKLRAGRERGLSRVPGVFATPEMNVAARRLTPKKLEAALAVLADVDRLAKGLAVPDRDADPWIELKSVVLFLAR